MTFKSIVIKKMGTALLLASVFAGGIADAAGFSYLRPSAGVPAKEWKTVVGWVGTHTVAEGETIIDIARNLELGYNDLEILYPDVDPWLPEPGMKVTIPSFWVVPPSSRNGIVINVPELRLYRFIPGTNLVETYPVGVGQESNQTPLGEYRVVERQEHPVWVVPPSLRTKYTFTQMEPGPNNPLGDYWLGLSANNIGIHGTNFPWAIGRQVSHGCIRLYPEHIKRLFPDVAVGTPVEIIYEPVKVGVLSGNVYVEVHPDTDGKVTDLNARAAEQLKGLGEKCSFSSDKLRQAIKDRNGVPVLIGSIQEGGGGAGQFRAAQKQNGVLDKSIN